MEVPARIPRSVVEKRVVVRPFPTVLPFPIQPRRCHPRYEKWIERFRPLQLIQVLSRIDESECFIKSLFKTAIIYKKRGTGSAVDIALDSLRLQASMNDYTKRHIQWLWDRFHFHVFTYFDIKARPERLTYIENPLHVAISAVCVAMMDMIRESKNVFDEMRPFDLHPVCILMNDVNSMCSMWKYFCTFTCRLTVNTFIYPITGKGYSNTIGDMILDKTIYNVSIEKSNPFMQHARLLDSQRRGFEETGKHPEDLVVINFYTGHMIHYQLEPLK